MVRCFVHYGGGAGPAARRTTSRPQGLELGHVVRPRAAAAVQPQDPPQGLPPASSTTPTASSATGASTGSTRSCGGPTRSTPRRVNSQPAAAPSSRDNTDAPDCQVATFEFETTSRHVGAPPVRRQQRREAQHRLLLLRHRGHVPHGLAGRLDVLPDDRRQAAGPRGRRSSTSRTTRTSRSCGPTSSTRIEQKRRPVCDIEIGHRSTNMAPARHALAEARPQRALGRAKQHQILDDAEAAALLEATTGRRGNTRKCEHGRDAVATRRISAPILIRRDPSGRCCSPRSVFKNEVELTRDTGVPPVREAAGIGNRSMPVAPRNRHGRDARVTVELCRVHKHALEMTGARVPEREFRAVDPILRRGDPGGDCVCPGVECHCVGCVCGASLPAPDIFSRSRS